MSLQSSRKMINPNFNTQIRGEPLALAVVWTSCLTQSSGCQCGRRRGSLGSSWMGLTSPGCPHCLLDAGGCLWRIPHLQPCVNEWSISPQSGFWNLNKSWAIIYKIVAHRIEIMKRSCFFRFVLLASILSETDSFHNKLSSDPIVVEYGLGVWLQGLQASDGRNAMLKLLHLLPAGVQIQDLAI